MIRQKNLLALLNDIKLLYSDLNRLILEYEITREWTPAAEATWKHVKPYGIINHEQHIYVCRYNENLITKYNLNHEIIEQITSIKSPAGIDIDIEKSLLYVASSTHVTLRSLQNKTILKSWKLPIGNTTDFRGIKVDGSLIYLTIRSSHQIFLCNSQDGENVKKFGNEKESSLNGNFHFPMGLTVNKNYIYICDRNNLRVQLLDKEKGLFFSEWKGFHKPYSIYYENFENIFYIGDWYSVQLYLSDIQIKNNQKMDRSKCIQRIGSDSLGSTRGEFSFVYSVCRDPINDRLFVCDYNNQRIQIFSRPE